MNTLSQQIQSLPQELQVIIYKLHVQKLQRNLLNELLDCKEAVFWQVESHINRSRFYNTNLEEEEYSERLNKFLTQTQLKPTDVVDYIVAKEYFDNL